jgi:hypothetical protein
VARPDLEDRIVGAGAERVGDAAEQAGIGEKVLAEPPLGPRPARS